MPQVKLLITDFDGTLVDTYFANLCAYQKAFSSCGLTLTEEQYRKCFGLRFDEFMAAMGVVEESKQRVIREKKSDYYPSFFDKLIVNENLLSFVRKFHEAGGLTAVASTARRINLMKALEHIDAIDCFSLILAGEDVQEGKPNPEIYMKALDILNVRPHEALVFEDSPVGLEAAHRAHLMTIQIGKEYFNGD